MTRSFSLSGDLAGPYVALACALAALSFGLLVLELVRGRRPGRLAIAASGALAVLALLVAVLRPVAILARGSLVGPRVVVLVDGSRSIDLPGLDGTRRETTSRALAELDEHASSVRRALFAFGQGAPAPFAAPGAGASFSVAPMPHSDLATALAAIAKSPDERPAAIVVVSDGRLDRPGEQGVSDAVKSALGTLEVPVHTVAVADRDPADASIRAVKAAGAAVAHQPFALRIEIGCAGGLACDDIPVTARELREEGAPTELASGTAKVQNGKAVVELQVTLDRAGPRILEVGIRSPSGDTIADNDKRFVAVDVTRDRVRVLHVAGRPTYDVRALRTWLKSDASVDVVAFFILRTPNDEVNATQDELALIPFPVDELFSEHLSSFDAVVLQDFNAKPYGLSKYLGKLADYVDKGGGLIMVGGPDAFVPGHYAGTPLAKVLPVELSDDGTGGVDTTSFAPRETAAGHGAPVLKPLRALIGDDWPEMPGADLLGDPRPGSIVLLEHPTRKTAKGNAMPVLALGEHESGRTIALGIDGSHRLLFSAFAASAAGRAHGAFWDAMLGWLMRDPRFEPASVELPNGCIAGEDTKLVLHPLPGSKGKAKLTIARLGSREPVKTTSVELDGEREQVEVPIGALDAGGYAATLAIGEGDKTMPTTRRDFACEKGGDEWADSRPDTERLQAIAKATGGKFVLANDASALPLPPATEIASERHVSPILPPWAWTLSAAVLLGVHWVSRRRSGLV